MITLRHQVSCHIKGPASAGEIELLARYVIQEARYHGQPLEEGAKPPLLSLHPESGDVTISLDWEVQRH
jgi:hypothetical protein